MYVGNVSIKLERVKESENNGAHFKVEFTKSRSVHGNAVKSFIAKLINKDGLKWEITDIAQNSEERLIELIKNCGESGIHVNEAAEELNLTIGRISQVKNKLVKEGRIKKSGRKEPMVLTL